MLKDEIAVVEKNGNKLRILGLKDHVEVNSPKIYSEEIKQIIGR